MSTQVVIIVSHPPDSNLVISVTQRILLVIKKAVADYTKIRGTNATDGHLFITRSGKPILIRNIRQIINRCFREVEIKGATVNDLRNTFIAQQLLNGTSLEYIAKIVGHKRLSSTERFLNLVKQEVVRKEKLGEL